jgi:hypothetical protein
LLGTMGLTERFVHDVETGNPSTIFLTTKHTDLYKPIDIAAVRSVTAKSLS